MDNWLLIGMGLGAALALAAGRAIRLRLERKRTPRVVELPNSHYTSRLVIDRDAHERWKAIPLDRVHEINRVEVVRLLAKIAESGVDRVTPRERNFLDRIAELNPPPPAPARAAGRGTRPESDAVWSDPFGFQPPLGSRPGGR